MVNAEIKKQMAIDYGLEHLWLVTNAVYAIGGGELRTPRYIEFAHPTVKVADARTADEIIDDTINNLC